MNNGGNLEATGHPAVEYRARKHGFIPSRTMTRLGSPWAAANNPLGCPLDTHGRVPSLAIGEVPREQRDTKLRNQEGPHNILSLAVPQPVPNKDTKATREEELDTTAKREQPLPEVVTQEKRKALDAVRRHMARPGDPVVHDNNPPRIVTSGLRSINK